MAIKSILVPVEESDYRDSVLSAAVAVARLDGGYIEGCAVTAPLFDAVAMGAMGGIAVSMPQPPEIDSDDLRRLFIEYMKSANLSAVDVPAPGPAFGWRRDDLLGDLQFAEYARLFDLVIAGRPATGSASLPRLETVESCLFEGARPVLVVPPNQIEQLGETIVVAWNCSTEAARAVSLSMGLLKAARRVLVLTIERGTVPGPTGADLVAMLATHGISAEDIIVPASELGVGEAILRHSASSGADLVIKGAYTHSRLRQRVFGGATWHILRHAEIPVLMAS